MGGGKRVLMVAPTPYFSDRGCHVQIFEVANSQQIQGNQVEIVTYHIGRDIGAIPTRRILSIPWYQKREAGPSIHKFYLDGLLMAKLLREALRFRPDILHAHLHEGAAIALPIARLLRVPVLLDMQGSLTGEMINHRFMRPGSFLHRIMHRIELGLHAAIDGILMWAYLRDGLLANFTFDQHKVFPVHYGVDLQVFRPYPKETLGDLYAKLNLNCERKVVVFLGLLNEYQGVDGLIECIPQVLRQAPNTHFLLMGYPDEERYRAQAARLGIADHVTLPGRIDYTQAARYLSLGDLAVAPKLTTMEGNGKLLNYLACGLPIVAFDLPGNLATLQDVGVFAPAGDYCRLADRLAELLCDADRRAALARRSRTLAEERYSWRAIGRTIDSVYTELLRRRQGREA